ncbi:hypothetical protein HPY42_00330 [Coprothermobacteraceae bacterium]|nr:hypothetical protein [Coprothermobacteraceae bacterium]
MQAGVRRFQGDLEAKRNLLNSVDTVFFIPSYCFDPSTRMLLPKITEAAYRALNGWQCIAIHKDQDGSCSLVFKGLTHEQMVKRCEKSQLFVHTHPEQFGGPNVKGVVFCLEDLPISGEAN